MIYEKARCVHHSPVPDPIYEASPFFDRQTEKRGI